MPKILVVEDQAPMVRALTRMLKEQGFEVVSARDGDEAIEKASSEKPDLILLDMILPEKNGYQVCWILRNKPETEHIPIIMLSAWTRDRGSDDPKNPDIYISKPFSTTDLLGHIRLLLETGPADASPPPGQE